MFKTEFSTWFGLTVTDSNQINKFKWLCYSIEMFIFVLFIPNVSAVNQNSFFHNFFVLDPFNDCYFRQMIKFYQSAAIDHDIDLALESMIFVSTHFIINTQLYCCLWNVSTLREMSAALIEAMAQGL